MSITLNGVLTVSTNSLGAYQTALAVTSHNIANTNTEGYTRQRAELQAGPSLNTTPGQIGEGVEVLNVERMRETLLDGNARQELGLQAKFNQMASTGVVVESALGDPTNPTLNKDLNNFFAAYNSLTTSPENLGVRQAVTTNAQILADTFNNAASQMNTLNSSLDATATQAASDINTMLKQVAALNKQIAFGTGSGNNPNDALDQRDLLLDKLSNYMDLTVTNGPNGMINISVNGASLVNGTVVSNNGVQTQVDAAGHLQVYSTDAIPVALATNGGQLQGLIQAHQIVDNIKSNLDDLAATFISRVNALCTGGFDLNGNAGVALFNGTDASTIAVNPAVLGDPTKIVAADTRASAGPPPVPNPGSNGVALAMAIMQNNTAINFITPLGAPSLMPSSSFNQAITSIVAGLGSTTKGAASLYDTYSANVNAIQAQRQSQNGVSMDEEVSNMLSFQRSYEASSKIISAVDYLMSVVIHMAGAGT